MQRRLLPTTPRPPPSRRHPSHSLQGSGRPSRAIRAKRSDSMSRAAGSVSCCEPLASDCLAICPSLELPERPVPSGRCSRCCLRRPEPALSAGQHRRRGLPLQPVCRFEPSSYKPLLTPAPLAEPATGDALYLQPEFAVAFPLERYFETCLHVRGSPPSTERPSQPTFPSLFLPSAAGPDGGRLIAE